MKDNLAALGKLFWQFEIAGVPLPRLVVQGVVGRREGEWWLKVWGERLLFCAADAPGRVFAVVTPCENEPNLAEFWRAAVKCGDWGEVLSISETMGSPSGHADFILLEARNGELWTRDCCGGAWIESSGNKQAAERYRLSSVASRAAAMFKIWQRPFPATERQDCELFWLRGSETEWQQVLQSCACLCYHKKPLDGFGFKVEPSEYIYFFYAHTPSGLGLMEGIDDEDHDVWSPPDRWKSVILRNFVLVGWEWESFEKRDQNLRNAWRIADRIKGCQIQLTLQPSQHQQLEARLYLRDWLRGKVPDAHIAKLLE